MSTEPVIVQKQMGYSRAEFMRLLPRALGSDAYTANGTEITFEADGRGLVISLGPESERRIALMRIPSMPVTLTFTGYDDDERDAFLVLFDRAYQRGGG